MAKSENIFDVWNLSDRKVNNTYNLIYSFYVQELANKITSIFKFSGLPDTVDENYFKLSLAMTGHCSLAKMKNNWYAVHGTRGGEPNAYYIPKNYIIANPFLGSETIDRENKDITVFYMTPFDECTTIGSGLFGLINRTADGLAHTDISINTALKNSRVVAFFEVTSDTQKTALNKTIAEMRNGEDSFGIKTPFDGEIKMNPYLNGANIPEIIRELIELKQFIIANFYHSIGINSNYNLKRAQISSEEIKTNDDVLIVNTYEMKSQLEKGCNEFNKKTGMYISVDYSEPWQILKEQEENVQEENAQEDSTNNGEGEKNDSERNGNND